jgi:phage terminase small subunit
MKRPPKTLTNETARKKWVELIGFLAADPPPAALDSLATYCLNFGRWVSAEKELAESGPIVRSQSGFAVESPYLGVSRRALAEMRRAAKELRLHDKLRVTSANEEPAKLISILGNSKKTG